MYKFLFKNYNLIGLVAGLISGIARSIGYTPKEIPSTAKIEPTDDCGVDDSFVIAPVDTPRGKRKKAYDTTPFTKEHYDIIMQAHRARICHNRKVSEGLLKERIPVTAITIFLNNTLCLNKSRQSYALVWCNKVSRDDLEYAVTNESQE